MVRRSRLRQPGRALQQPVASSRPEQDEQEVVVNGFVVVAGALPPGVLPNWTVTPTAADLVFGEGFIVTGPWSELAAWPPQALAAMAGPGEPDPYALGCTIDGAVWADIRATAQPGASALDDKVLAATVGPPGMAAMAAPSSGAELGAEGDDEPLNLLPE